MTTYTSEETQQHLMRLAQAYTQRLSYQSNYGYGAWNVDEYRPFGNSICVATDILEQCEIEPEGDEDGPQYYSTEQKAYADYLYQELLGPFLKKIVRHYCQIAECVDSIDPNGELDEVVYQIQEILRGDE